MAWETRGNGRYYYRKVRAGRRVVSEYVGSGEVAQLIAQLEEVRQEQGIWEQMKQKAEREALEADQAVDRELDRIGGLVRSLQAAVLLVNDYHTHKGQWRRRRCFPKDK
jgi:hypothetical protein